MSDHPEIVERLRAEGSPLACEAADEIVRLSQQLDIATADLAIAYGTLDRRAADPEPPFTVRDETPNVPR